MPPTHSPSDFTMLVITILNNDVFHALSGLDIRRAYGPNGLHPIILKNCASVLTSYLVKFFSFLPFKCHCLSSFPIQSVLMNSLCLRAFTALILSSKEL